MNITSYRNMLAAGTLVGGAGSLAAVSRRSEDKPGIGALATGGVAAGIGGIGVGKYGGPQAQWFVAVRATKQMHGRQLQVIADMKSGDIMKYDQEKYLKESADIVNNAKQKIMSAASPKKGLLFAAAAVGSAATGALLVSVVNKFDN